MARAIVFATVTSFRNLRARIELARGIPRAGQRRSTGELAGEDPRRWTHAAYDAVRIVDTLGRIGTPGATYWLLGPLRPAEEAFLSALANPPTIVTVPDAVFRRGTRIRRRISAWLNGAPSAFAEETEDFDEDAVGGG